MMVAVARYKHRLAGPLQRSVGGRAASVPRRSAATVAWRCRRTLTVPSVSFAGFFDTAL